MTARTWYELLRETVDEFSKDKATRLGAALAFYTLLSLSPMLLVVLAIAGKVFGPEAARGELFGQIDNLVGPDGAKAIQDMLAATQSGTGGGWFATVVGIGTLVFGATGVFAQLQDALNTVWGTREDAKGFGIWRTVKDRLLSFSAVCGMAFLLLVSLVLTAVLNALHGYLSQYLPGGGWGLSAANHILSFALTATMFGMIFKLLPHARPTWRDVWIGAAITAGLFTLGKYLIGLYLGTAAVGSTYGAAGSLVVLLVWVYYSTQILLFGAEFTEVYARRRGSGWAATRPEPAVLPPTADLAFGTLKPVPAAAE